MKCKNCGFETKEESQTCPNCESTYTDELSDIIDSESNENSAVDEDLSESESVDVSDKNPSSSENDVHTNNHKEPSKGFFENKLKTLLKEKPMPVLITGVAIIAVVIIVLIAVKLFEGDSYEKVLDRYFNALSIADADSYISLLADDYFTNDDKYTTEDEYKEYFQQELDGAKETFEWYCGSDFKITYEIKSFTEFTESQIDQELINIYGRDNGIQEAADLTVEVTVQGSESTEVMTSVISLVKLNGKWYLAESYL